MRTSAGVTVVPPGALLRIGPQVWHSIKARSTPWREDAMYCSVAVARCVNPVPEADDGMPGAEPAPVSVFACEPWGREFSQCHRLLHEIADTGREDAGIAARALVRRLLAQWIPLQAGWTTESGDADDRLRRSYGLIATGFQQRLTLDDLAEAVNWHPIHLHRRFKDTWGFTPHELLVGHRIEYARDLMAGGARVTYAAHAAGFSDQSHLHKTFMSTYAVAPSEYRRLSALDALQPPAARNGIVD
ncbi:helix-turn-helix transcriptional regulator [Variovorax guangxiensis]|uniref:helix-turn-helix transcriptional regulator n=1 Tax=Variovorax guangxiensis TaxID=1775474 RepID=UPI001404F039|nr:helix-turn-helix transcriptional regulator [Variovorax guangxiensis]